MKNKSAKPQKKTVNVVAALIFEGDKFLICQRPPEKARGLLWEFVGGKIEPGETGPEALARECCEELGITVSVGKEFITVKHQYPDVRVKLTVYLASIVAGRPQLLEHAAMKWIYPSQTAEYSFCPADKDVLKKIYSVYGKRTDKLKTGKYGERKAASYLKRRGYKILERNLHTPFCEVDLVAARKDVMVFCEVKTRLNENFGSPAEAVDERRRFRYVRAAKYYAARKDVTVRFDVIEVFPNGINHIENAYGEDC